MSAVAAPTRADARIESLDVLRGFALLGILLVNVIGFGLPSAAYSNAGPTLADGDGLDRAAWVGVELFAEGGMRALFSILFGAGVLLFADGRGAALHYRRTSLLLLFGLVDGFLLLWNGDILVTYALAGFVLWFARGLRVRTLVTLSGLLFVLMTVQSIVMQMGLAYLQDAAAQVAAAPDPTQLAPMTRDLADQWAGFAADYAPDPARDAAELALRRGGYASAFAWNAQQNLAMLGFVLPVFMFWDALAMMLLGMALYRSGVLQGDRSPRFYGLLGLAALSASLLVNGYEVVRIEATNFDILATLGQLRPSYHLGRLLLALGWLGLVLWCVRVGALSALRVRLAAVGRMALTNYLAHSVIAALVFSGLGLVGELGFARLYVVVAVIWMAQLLWSPWWLARHGQGPVEALWRRMTYGSTSRPQDGAADR